jgi:hypothetical protein
MKSLKLFVSVAIVCLLVGASGAAMAVEECLDGILEGEIVDDIIIENRSCVIDDATVTGTIQVTNAEEITIIGSKVSGRVLVQQSRYATVAGNKFERNLVVRNNETAIVAANRAPGRKIRVNSNFTATVKKNVSDVLICKGNTRLNSVRNQNNEEDCSR